MRFPVRGRYLAAILAFALVGVSSGAGAEKSTPFSRRNPIVEAVQKTKAAIVTVKVPRHGAKDTVGTGVIVDERGIIITNRHVTGSSGTVMVRLASGTEVSARIVLCEPSWDLSILRIHAGKQTALPLGPADDLMVGETVIAVGHPYGYTNTVSVGIVSALERQITRPTGDVLTGLIQTDASINPGNSGGPLLNVNGELIGINVAVREGAQNIAFAINAGSVKQVLNKHLSAERVAGVSHGLAVEEKIVAEVGARQKVLVASPKAGLKTGDEIVTVGERSVSNSFDVERALWDAKPGQQVPVKVVRGGQQMTVSLTLSDSAGSTALVQNAPVRNNGMPAAPATAVSTGNRR